MARISKRSAAVRDEIEREIAELEHARDEIKLKLHLCSMDLRSSWRRLDRQLDRLEERFGREGDHVADATRDLAAELKQSFRELRQRVV